MATDQRLVEAQARIDARKPAAKPRAEIQTIGGSLAEISRRIEARQATLAAPAESPEEIRQRKLEAARAREPIWLRDVGVPARYRGGLDEALVPAELRAWTEKFPGSLARGGGALIVGPAGTGKTAAACWLVREAYRRGRLLGSPEEGLEWVHPSALFVKAADVIDATIEKRRDWINRLGNVGLLILDDWGVGYEGSAWGVAGLDRLIDARWEALRATVVTSNLLPGSPASSATRGEEETFAARYPRAFDRLADRVGPGVVLVNRPSLRTSARTP